jgi:hypothetical protein
MNNGTGFNGASLLGPDSVGFVSVIPAGGIGIWASQADIFTILKVYTHTVLHLL